MTAGERAALAMREYQLAVINNAPKDQIDELLRVAVEAQQISVNGSLTLDFKEVFEQ